MKLHSTKIDIEPGTRLQIAGILKERLADAIDLKSHAKQAHWNVKGIGFIALHELFDRAAGEIDTYVDDIAERITTLGGTAMGTVRVAAANSTLSEYPLEITDGTAHIDALSSSLADFGARVRADIDRTAELGDADTADLFTEISRGIDKLLWLVEAHIQ